MAQIMARLIFSVLLAVAALAQTVKFGIPVKAGPMDELRVKDYAPASSLVVAKTHVPKARFAVIDRLHFAGAVARGVHGFPRSAFGRTSLTP